MVDPVGRLAGKVAVITGAPRRIGRAVVLGPAREGADVAVHARSACDEIEAVAEQARALAIEFADRGVTANCDAPEKIGGKRSANTGESPEMPGGERPAVVSLLAIVVFFGLFVGWAATSRLPSASLAPGMVSVEGARRRCSTSKAAS